MLAWILVMVVNKNANRKKKKPNNDMGKSPVFSNDLCLEKSSTFQREEERKAFPQTMLSSPVFCIPTLVLWLSQAVSHPEAHEG